MQKTVRESTSNIVSASEHHSRAMIRREWEGFECGSTFPQSTSFAASFQKAAHAKDSAGHMSIARADMWNQAEAAWDGHSSLAFPQYFPTPDDSSTSSFFIPVPGQSSSSAPSSSSSPPVSSFDFSNFSPPNFSCGVPLDPSSPTPFQTSSLPTSSSDNSSTSLDRPSRRRKLTAGAACPILAWGEESTVHGPSSFASEVFLGGAEGAQELARGHDQGCEPRDLRSVPIERYSWLNEELAVRVSIPLPGVDKLPASCIQVDFGTESLSVTVQDNLNGVEHKLAFKQLYGEIVPKECSYYRRADKLVLKLIKVPGRMDAYNKGRPLEWFALKFD